VEHACGILYFFLIKYEGAFGTGKKVVRQTKKLVSQYLWHWKKIGYNRGQYKNSTKKISTKNASQKRSQTKRQEKLKFE
jgi:hypothetical protein